MPLRAINRLLFSDVTRTAAGETRNKKREGGSLWNSLYVAADRKESREIEFARTYDTQEREEGSDLRGWEGEIKTSPEGNRVRNDQNSLDPSTERLVPILWYFEQRRSSAANDDEAVAIEESK